MYKQFKGEKPCINPNLEKKIWRKLERMKREINSSDEVIVQKHILQVISISLVK